MNYSIHFIMYAYYAVMATKLVWIPKPIAMLITTLQLSQMVVGIGVQIALIYNVDTPDCKTSRNHILGGSLMYGSYFILFLNFFINTYFKPKPKAKITFSFFEAV